MLKGLISRLTITIKAQDQGGIEILSGRNYVENNKLGRSASASVFERSCPLRATMEWVTLNS